MIADADRDRLRRRLLGTDDDLWVAVAELGLADDLSYVRSCLTEMGIHECDECGLWIESPGSATFLCRACRAETLRFDNPDFGEWAEEEGVVSGDEDFVARMRDVLTTYRHDLVALYAEARVVGDDRPILVLYSPYEPFGWRLYEQCLERGLNDPGLAEAVADRSIPYLIHWTVLDASWAEEFHSLCVYHGAPAPRNDDEFRVLFIADGQWGVATLSALPSPEGGAS